MVTDNLGGNPAIDITVFPGPPQDICWSSTTMATETAKAWAVMFSERGQVTGADFNMKTDGRATRCVRDGL